MNFFSKIFFFIFFILFQSVNSFSNEIVFIDVDLLFSQSNKGKAIILKLNNLNKENQNKLNLKEKELINLQNEIKKQQNIINKTELDKKISDLDKIVKDFTSMRESFLKDYQAKKNNELKLFFNSISPLLEEYMVKKSIKIIFDKKNIFLANNNYDITEEILNIIDNGL